MHVLLILSMPPHAAAYVHTWMIDGWLLSNKIFPLATFTQLALPYEAICTYVP